MPVSNELQIQQSTNNLPEENKYISKISHEIYLIDI